MVRVVEGRASDISHKSSLSCRPAVVGVVAQCNLSCYKVKLDLDPVQDIVRYVPVGKIRAVNTEQALLPRMKAGGREAREDRSCSPRQTSSRERSYHGYRGGVVV